MNWNFLLALNLIILGVVLGEVAGSGGDEGEEEEEEIKFVWREGGIFCEPMNVTKEKCRAIIPIFFVLINSITWFWEVISVNALNFP